jgi:hypothetical protein
MRTFTPPSQVLGRTIPTQIFDGTTQGAPPVPDLTTTTGQILAQTGQTPGQPLRNIGEIEPERAHVVDAGFVQQLLPQCPTISGGMPSKAPAAAANCPSLEVGGRVYYKWATDLIDDGQFGQAYTLTAFNYAKGENYGTELTLRFRYGGFSAATSWAYALQHATQVVSNQTLFSPDDLAYIQTHWIYTDHDQALTGSGRVAYRWTDTSTWLDGTTVSGTFIYGSGLRSTPAGVVCPNCGQLPSYWQFNTGMSHEFAARILHGHLAEARGSGEDSRRLARLLHQGRSSNRLLLGRPLCRRQLRRRFQCRRACADVDWLGSTNPSGVLGGLQFGYNYLAAPSWLVGVEAELGWSSAQGKTNFVDPAGTAALSITSDQNWYDSLSGRVGYLIGPLMIYGKGGAAWMNADYKMEVNSGLSGLTLTNTTRPGWVAGAGFEYMLGSH